MASQSGTTIQEYLDKNIKDLIKEFPPVASVLSSFDIGCVTCGLGTCLFKDIVKVHNLDSESETELMTAVNRIIFPGHESDLPKIGRKIKPPAAKVSYSPPMKELVAEHTLIKRLLALVPVIIQNLDVTNEEGRTTVRQSVDFIQTYADKFHHAKEEAILFKYFDENLDIIKAFCSEHERGRAHVKAALTGLAKGDKEAVATNLIAYQELLSEHIKKEDEILYRWMDKSLTTNQIGQLFTQFQEKDDEFGDTPSRYWELIVRLEKKFNLKEKIQ